MPLTWLQAFETAGRLGSFKDASAELSVSPSNISHQIRNLESHLGVPLFSRSGRNLQLTDEGDKLLVELTAGFEIVRQALARPRPDDDVLRIGTFPFLANEILTPRMATLQRALAGREIRLHTQNDVTWLTHAKPDQRLDVIIRYGNSDARFPGLIAEPLTKLKLVPVIGPDMAEPQTPSDFLQLPLARVIGPFAGWDRWRAAHAPQYPPPEFALQTDSYHAAMLAVSRGEVACLAVAPYIKPWLDEARLQALSRWELPITDQCAYLVYARHNQGHRDIVQLADWLRDQWA